MAEELSPDDVKVIFEDDKILIVSPLTYEGNKYYGKKTPWFEEGWYGIKEFEKRFENGGRIYYIINKETGEKDGFYKDQYGQLFYNENSKIGKPEIEDLVTFAPSARKIIWELTGSDIFKKLVRYAKGKIDKNALEHSDELIHDIKENREVPGESIILLRFDEDEELFKILDLSDDDIWFLNVINSRDYEFTDGDRMYEDNKEGYGIFRWFNGENMQKLRDISRVVLPNEEFNEQNEQFMGNLYKKLDIHFDRELDRMNWDYIDEYNSKSSEYARTEISNEFNNYLNEKGFNLVRRYDTISTTIADLIYLYSIRGRKHDDLKVLLENELKPSSKDRFGGWGENYYEYEGKIDSDELNSEFEYQLEKIWDKLSENGDMKKYFDLYDRITSKYKFDSWYPTPKDKSIIFRVRNIDPESLKIITTLRKSDSNSWDKQHAFSEEDFNKFLYQPELFSIFDEE